MPFQPVRLTPGINIQETPTLNQTSWSDCNFIRFMDGMPQKLGGWQKYINATFDSPIRALHAWQDLTEADHLAVGAEDSLGVVTDGNITSITPQYRSQSVTPSFTTVIGDSDVTVDAVDSDISIWTIVDIVTPVSVGGGILYGPYPVASVASGDQFVLVTDLVPTAVDTNAGVVPEFDVTDGEAVVLVTLPDHGKLAGDGIEFRIPTTVGGITIEGYYTILSAPTADTFTIVASNAATSTTSGFMNGGDVFFGYYIAIGPPSLGAGWGTGDWGDGAWGLGTDPEYVAGTDIPTTNWTLDNWGEILIACQTDGALYYWRPNSGFQTCQAIPNAPIRNIGCFVSSQAQILVAYGTVGFSKVYNPLLVRWSDAGDFTQWTPMSINQSGSYVIPDGNRIVGALQVGQRNLIFTDTSVWDMSYIGPPDIFGFNRIASNVGLIGLHGVAKMGDAVFWMSSGNFYVYDGNGISSLPCPVWDRVYQNLGDDSIYSVAAANSSFGEISFYYPGIVGGETVAGSINQYVKFNVDEKTWDYGALQRTAWIDSSILGPPIGATYAGYIYQHEIGNDADTLAMDSYITSGWFMITEGDPEAFVDLLLPDFKYGQFSESPNAQMQVTAWSSVWPSSTPRQHGPYAFGNTSTFINTRARGRMMMMKFGSMDLGSFWRLGDFRYRGAISGRR